MEPFRGFKGSDYPNRFSNAVLFADYERALKPFQEVMRKAPACQIFLPRWMEDHESIGRIMKF